MGPVANLAALHRRTAARFGPKVALRGRVDGIIRSLSWADYRGQADAMAEGLIRLGVEAGDRVAIRSRNRIEWAVADVAILTAGAVTVPIPVTMSEDQVDGFLRHVDARGVLVETRAEAERVKDRGETRVWDGWIGVLGPEPDWPVTYAGLTSSRPDPAERLRREAGLTPDSLATIAATSGTTGRPVGVMLTHGNLISNATGVVAATGGTSADLILGTLPLAHIYARTCDHLAAIVAGATLHLAGPDDPIAPIGPTEIRSVPRFYEKLRASAAGLDGDALRSFLLARLGPNLRRLASGGAPLPVELVMDFAEAGLPIHQGYGLTECAPVVTTSAPGSSRPGTVGRPIAGTEIRTDADGEVLVRGPGVMPGYWRDPEATAAALGPDGWLRTGDLGSIDGDGYLTIVGRKKDLIVLSTGRKVAPGPIERLLTSDAFIDHAIVHGDGRPYLTALIVPNLPRLLEAVGPIDLAGPTLTDPAALRFLAGRIAEATQPLSEPERVRRFALLARPLRAEAGDLTETGKVRRAEVVARFAAGLPMLHDVRSL